MNSAALGLASTIVFQAFELYGTDPGRLDAFLCHQCDGDAALLEAAREQAVIERSIREKGFLAGNAAETFGQAISEGTVIDGFQVGRELGRGAMGTVYRAKQLSLGREVAFKTLNNLLGPKAARRFEYEARALAGIQSPRVVNIYDFGQFCGRPYIAMEFFDGASLSDVLTETSPVDWRSRVEMSVEIGEALRDIHAHGIAHRDVKPSNVLVRGKIVKLVDFGVAWRECSTETVAGQAMGTPAYMPPEQIRRELGGPGTGFDQYKLCDIYSFGIVLFEVFTGTRPFDGETREEVEKQILHSPMPLERLRAHCVPVAIVEAIRKATEKDPGLRTNRAGDIVEVLRSCLSDPEPESSVKALPHLKRFRIATALTACSAVLGGSVLWKLAGTRAAVVIPQQSARPKIASNSSKSQSETPAMARKPGERIPATLTAQHKPIPAPPNTDSLRGGFVLSEVAAVQPSAAELPSAMETVSLHPAPVSAAEVIAPEEREWARIKDTESSEALLKFAATFPESPYTSKARDLAAHLEWARLRTNFEPVALNAFTLQFPGHALSAVADSIRHQLDSRVRASGEIRAVLSAYTRAMTSLKIAKVETTYEMTVDIRQKVRGMLDASSKLEMTLTPASEPVFPEPLREDAASGPTVPQLASVECTEVQQITDHNGDAQPPLSRSVSVQLKRRGQNWLIASVR